MRIGRRRLLQALGLGALSGALDRGSTALASGSVFPSRIVFYVQPHGHIPNAWNMAIPGSAPGQFAERALAALAPTDFSPTLRPLYPFRDRLLAIEGLSHTSALADIAAVMKAGAGDLNNHQIGVADVLTGSRALQRTGTYCTGGSRSLDQELAARTAGPGRFDSRVYGFDYIPNSIVSPFSYLGPGQATPTVSDVKTALADLLGYATPAAATQTRADRLSALRPSVLDAVGREYALLAPRLGAEGRQKLDAHRALVRELEVSLGAMPSSPRCDTAFDAPVTASAGSVGPAVRQFMGLVRLAFACDLTRVVTFVAPVPQCPELGYPAEANFHMYGHQSIDGSTSCGQTYSPLAAQAMTDLDAWHAGHVAYLLGQLDSVAEGPGTLLDHTVVVWVTELATPTHQHFDVCTLLAGGCNGFFGTGRYVRYPRTLPNPIAGQPLTGPGHNRLHVTLLRAMGQPDSSFGMTGAVAADGTALSLSGPLTELQAHP
jgi:hypothetical protein